MDTRFSSAIHMLILIAGSAKPLTSEKIAESVGTNPSYIRKIAALLKKHGIIFSRQGVIGFALTERPERLSLFRIYQAISETEEIHVFDLHQNPNDKCIVGRHIRPVLTGVFRDIEEKAEQELRHTTLMDCMQKMKFLINQSEIK